MISVFLSPNIPPNFVDFAIQLRASGAVVLGLGDDAFEDLSHDLRTGLTEYYRVSNMHNYDELLRALGYFTHLYGKIGHIDSHNEYWLETEARLRTDFNIPGINMDDIYKIKRKSEMKGVFKQAGLNPARGRVCRDENELRGFINAVGYPICAKPDIGVGAAKTFKMSCDDDIANYLQEKLPQDYIVEEFIDGQIISFDGLVNGQGVPLFTSSLRYSKGVMEAVNDDSDIYYYTVRNIEPSVVAAGLATVKAFDVRARFFHLEFFFKDDGAVIPLEVNIRPPGGLTLNMFNYMFDFDCFKIWSQMIVNGVSEKREERPYFAMYAGRKDHIPYALTHEQVLKKFKPLIMHHERLSSVFALAIGNYGYVLRHPELEPLIEAAEAIQQRRS